MNYQQALQSLKNYDLKPVYTIVGSEAYLRDEFTQTLIDKVVQMDVGELDITRIDMKEQTIMDVLDEANMYSFFSSYRIVIVDQMDFITGSATQKLTDKEQKALLSYIDAPNPDTVLIFNCLADSVDKRRKVTKALMKDSEYIDITVMDDRDVANYLQQYLQHAPFKLSKEAVQELLMRTHYQLTSIMTELNKFETYAAGGKSITLDVVKQLVPRTIESDVFELTNAVVNLQIARATQIYQDLLLNNNEPIALHALLLSQFRLFIQVRILSGRGFLEGDIAKELNVHPYRVKLAMQNGRKLPYEALLELYQEMARIDFNMKQGIGVKETYFYLILTKLNDSFLKYR
ncbi:DNA polymerase III subunit delta [Aerococcaceae bacterium DSM 111022]|nr:DNA polymerase III subunit delta [Aerococcaceae bacterium DSM 111022]